MTKTTHAVLWTSSWGSGAGVDPMTWCNERQFHTLMGRKRRIPLTLAVDPEKTTCVQCKAALVLARIDP